MSDDPTANEPDQEPVLIPQRSAKRRAEALKQKAGDVQERVGTAMEQAKIARETSTIIDIIFRTGERDREAGGSIIAAALAFRFFLLSLPLSLFLVLTVGLLVGGTDEVTEVFSGAGVGGLVIQSVAAAQTAGILSWIITLVSAIIVSAWAGLGLAKALNQSSRFAWGLPYVPLRDPIPSTGIVLGALTGLILLTPTIGFMHARVSLLMDILVAILGVLVTALAWLLILQRLQRPEGVPWTALLPGALVFGVVLKLLSLVTAVWVSYRASAASDAYGALGNAVALLAWLAIIGRLAVGSSVLNAALWDRAHPSEPSPND